MRELWTWSVVAALVMGILVWGLTFWVIIAYRRRKDDPEFPRQTAYNVPLELAYTAAPFVAVCVLFYFTVVVQNYVLEKEDNPNVVVDVTAFQWNWKFGYRTIDLQDGTARYEGTDEVAQDAVALQPYEPGTEGEHGGGEGGEHEAPVPSTASRRRTCPTSTTTRSRRSAPAKRFRCSCFPPASASSSTSRRPM